MENYSSKICTKCYSAQDPAARFCDNCGKAFAATAATDGNISIVTKTFLKRQVAETRPLFWLCIIIVGMLGVFGFAQAGLYLAKPGAITAEVSQKPVGLVPKDTTEASKTETGETRDKELTRPADALDLNDSVFEMRDGDSAASKPAASKRHTLSGKVRPVIPKPELAVNTSTAPPSAKADTGTEKPVSEAERPAEKPADPAPGPKKYIRGPMGGCYYISSSGSKRYVDRGLCS